MKLKKKLGYLISQHEPELCIKLCLITIFLRIYLLIYSNDYLCKWKVKNCKWMQIELNHETQLLNNSMLNDKTNNNKKNLSQIVLTH
jgi:hypothetical protein